jgi:hypothetical protein
MLEYILKKPRRSSGRIGRDGSPLDVESFFVRLDDGIDHIAEFARDIELVEGLTRVRTESAHTIGESLSRDR